MKQNRSSILSFGDPSAIQKNKNSSGSQMKTLKDASQALSESLVLQDEEAKDQVPDLNLTNN